MTSTGYLIIAIILWSALGHWFMCSNAPHDWLAKVKPIWMGNVLHVLFEGPMWWGLELIWWLLNRPRPDRD